MAATDVQVENLRDALRQLQRASLIGLAASASLLLLTLSAESGALYIRDVGHDIFTLVKALLKVAHIVAGVMALGHVGVARTLSGSIKDDGVRDLALSYPTFSASPRPLLRFLTWHFPPVVFLVGMLVWWRNEVPSNAGGYLLTAVMLGLAPYVAGFWWSGKLVPGR